MIFFSGMAFFLIIILICSIYRSFSIEVPILMYHHINNWDDHYTVSIKQFNEQLAYLSYAKYQTITLSQLYEFYRGGKKLPRKPIIITFDDAYEDVYVNALPVLKRFNMVATIFIITKYVGDYNSWDSYPNKPVCLHMSWEKLRLWLDQGMEVGSHSVTHPYLSKLSEKEIFDELQNSKLMIEDKLKTTIKFFCYPYGDFNQLVKENLKIIGYHGALAIREGTALWHNDLYAHKRISINPNLNITRLKIRISPWSKVFKALKLENN